MAGITQLGRYELNGEPMTGGMGAVYVGADPVLDRKVAVKILHGHLTSQKGFRDRFLREAKILARLKHRNITHVYEAGDSDQGLYLAMEYVEGVTLEDAIFRGMYRSPKHVLPIVKQVCEALDYAHSEGIIHRDIKPSNVMVKPNGDVMLMDFGIARLDGQSNMTQDGQTIGTPHYMSPEQCKGLQIDSRSDLYSLAIVVYEMLSGARPFGGENLFSIINRQINDTPAPINVHVAGIPAHMINAINRALSKNPADRPQTAMQFYSELAGAAAVAVTKRKQKTPTPIVSGSQAVTDIRLRRRQLYLLVVAVISVGLLSLVTVAMWPGHEGGGGGTIVGSGGGGTPPPPPPDKEKIEADRLATEADRLYRKPNENYIAARDLCNQALLLVPDHYDALMTMCASQIKLGDNSGNTACYASALSYWKKAMAVAFVGDLTPEENKTRKKDVGEYGIWLKRKGQISHNTLVGVLADYGIQLDGSGVSTR